MGHDEVAQPGEQEWERELTQPVGVGMKCPQRTKRTEKCIVEHCPMEACHATKWKKISECDAKCDHKVYFGQILWERIVTPPADMNGCTSENMARCCDVERTPSTYFSPCMLDCEGECQMRDWTDWGGCTLSRGSVTRIRYFHDKDDESIRGSEKCFDKKAPMMPRTALEQVKICNEEIKSVGVGVCWAPPEEHADIVYVLDTPIND